MLNHSIYEEILPNIWSKLLFPSPLQHILSLFYRILSLPQEKRDQHLLSAFLLAFSRLNCPTSPGCSWEHLFSSPFTTFVALSLASLAHEHLWSSTWTMELNLLRYCRNKCATPSEIFQASLEGFRHNFSSQQGWIEEISNLPDLAASSASLAWAAGVPRSLSAVQPVH